MPTPVDISDPFRALSDPTRREIVSLLAGGAQPVRAIAGRFPRISRPAVSKHLRILREGGLVSEERSGRERYYSLDRGTIVETLEWMESVILRAAGAKKERPPERERKLETEPKAKAEPVPATDASADSNDWKSW